MLFIDFSIFYGIIGIETGQSVLLCERRTNMKKCLVFLLAMMILMCPLSALASNEVAVKINGEDIEFDVPAQIINDRTMLPMRKIFEVLSATVEWFGETQVIMATRGGFHHGDANRPAKPTYK